MNDPNVRTLAWLLEAPDLLDPRAPLWQGRVATLGELDDATRDWLTALDLMPAALHAFLDRQTFTRLGRYAESLLAFYLEHQGRLFAHGVQVRAARNQTIGEFDFLLQDAQGLIHWEFAAKLYLLESSGHGLEADYFVGPNLADTLGAKIRKIMERQLSLSQHPAAQIHLPQPVVAAQALVKGWLFYHGKTPIPTQAHGISTTHCRGFWCPVAELGRLPAEHYIVLPRLSWLAPAKVKAAEILGRDALKAWMTEHFSEGAMPALVALMEPQGDYLLEVDRGFIVPDDWRSRAEVRIRRA